MSVGLVVNPAMRGLRADSSMDGSEAPSEKILIRSKEVGLGMCRPRVKSLRVSQNRRRDTKSSFWFRGERAVTGRQIAHEFAVERRVVDLEVRVLSLHPEGEPQGCGGEGQRERDRDHNPAYPAPGRQPFVRREGAER